MHICRVKRANWSRRKHQKMFQQNVDGLASQSIGSRVTLREETTAEWIPGAHVVASFSLLRFLKWFRGNYVGLLSCTVSRGLASIRMSACLGSSCSAGLAEGTLRDTRTCKKGALCLQALLVVLWNSPTRLRRCDNIEINSTFQTRMDLWSCVLKFEIWQSSVPTTCQRVLQTAESMHDQRRIMWSRQHLFVLEGKWSLLSNKLCCSLDCEQNSKREAKNPKVLVLPHNTGISLHIRRSPKGWANSFFKN